jgi:hypothetical protein
MQAGWFSVHPFDKEEKQYQTYSRYIKVLMEENSKEPIEDNDDEFTANLLSLSVEEVKNRGIKAYTIEDPDSNIPIKVLISSDSFTEIIKSLDFMGINEKTIFSDMTNLCSYIGRKFK